ncbi:hypothetical protein LCGC14_0544100 [marine sediment metagenome]|uniref:Uncharacterized protein n=1 Tax=marine sediment metagenome TaxID=412755 RepID=A0A0F9RRY7_9ZZZZ|nr:MAG: hypothetical protein Lokiarch_03410 [Candidatus Lokiarchaeum sp. GC14_75]
MVGSNALQFNGIVHLFQVLESTPLGVYSATGSIPNTYYLMGGIIIVVKIIKFAISILLSNRLRFFLFGGWTLSQEMYSLFGRGPLK